MEITNTPAWRRSSKCANCECIEVARISTDRYLIRDSKRPEAEALSFTGAEWAAFVAGIQAGDFQF
jgi:hypothetical protein